ncbi:MAG: VWA domain-containing protein, partial [Acidobacteria bacterium]|nr:VWA domain-containing protein [Acidobacteriota bacterium]
VVVRDRAGKRLAGLTREDFALFVDGKKVEITNFSGPVLGAAPAPAPAAGGRQRLNLVVCVDSVSLEPFRRNRVLEQVRGFVRKDLRPDDLVMLVSFDPDFHLRHPFRSSMSALGPELDAIAGSVPASMAGEGEATDPKYLYTQLERLLRSLGGLEGRKALLYVGNGRPGAVDALHRVTTAANANLVTLFSFEAAGLRVHADASEWLPRESMEQEQMADWNRQDSLFSMARETGGRSALNGNDFSQDFDEIAGDLEAAYSLGFAPSRPGDGKIHQVRVEVDRQGARAAYRGSYRERTPDERLEGEVEAALVHGFAGNPLGAALEIAGATPAAAGLVRVALKLSVPLDRLALVPGPDGRTGQLSIFVADVAAGLGRASIRKLHVPLRIAEADFAKAQARPFDYDLTLVVAPGRRRLALAVRDDVARVSSALGEDIEVDAGGAGRAVVTRSGQPVSR